MDYLVLGVRDLPTSFWTSFRFSIRMDWGNDQHCKFRSSLPAVLYYVHLRNRAHHGHFSQPITM